MGQIRRAYIRIGGVLLEDLSKEDLKRVKQKATDFASEIVTGVVIRMAEEGSTVEEIGRFLKLDGYYERKEEGRDETN